MTEKKQQYISTSWLPYICFKLTLLYTLNSSHVSCLCTFSFWQYFRQWLPLSQLRVVHTFQSLPESLE